MKILSLHYGLPVGMGREDPNAHLVWQALYSGNSPHGEVNSIVEYGGIYWKVVDIDIPMCCVQLAPVGVSGED